MSVQSSMKIHSWCRKGVFETVFFSARGMGGESEWTWLDIEICLYITGGALKNGGGRWRVGGRPGLKHDRRRRKRRRQQVTDKRVEMETSEEAQNNLVTSEHKIMIYLFLWKNLGLWIEIYICNNAQNIWIQHIRCTTTNHFLNTFMMNNKGNIEISYTQLRFYSLKVIL